MQKETFYPEIQRLRGVACLFILIQHMTLVALLRFPREVLPSVLHNGRGGLPLFFVISGFIITTLLLQRLKDAQTQETFFARLGAAIDPLKVFFLRRFFRLAPLAFFNLLIAAGVFFWAYDTDILPYQTDWGLSFVRAGIEHFFCVYNFSVARYAEVEHIHYGGLGPYWSLSVEGQFYLCWPILLLLAKTPSRQALLALCLCCIGSFVARPLIELWGEGTPYYHTLYNFDGLFLGAFLAFLKTIRTPSSLPASYSTRFVMILLVFVIWIYPGVCGKHMQAYDFAPILGSAGVLVWWAAQNKNIVLGNRFIAPLLEFIGERSYTIYVTQLLTMRFAQWLVDSLGLFRVSNETYSDFYSIGQFFIFLGILIVFVECSYRWIETPLRRFARKIT
ncbi:MAG: acyltransferase [Holosporales bacterium]|jgi:peptidoglycan/LPS O-acetylase OafA/YrhL|nr:acyltransferase [Holosporales bacterium]